MTLSELKEIIKDLPDEMPIGCTGHYGEYLECYSISVKKNDTIDGTGTMEYLEIETESAGNYPD